VDLRTELALDRFLAAHGGVATRAQLLGGRAMSRHQLDNAVKRGELVTLARGTYCRVWDVERPSVREAAAVASIGRCALSHVSALRRYGLDEEFGVPVHVTTSSSRMPRAGEGVVVHRVGTFPPVVSVRGLATVSLPHALVTSWRMLAGVDQRRPVIRACRERLVHPTELTERLDALPKLPGRRSLRMLITLLIGGCESELELWGHTNVFNVPGLRHCVRQRVVRTERARHRLDRAYEAERVGVELDGAAFHGSASQRERDLRRDADLAAAGWLVVRFSHRRLHDEPDSCRRDLLAVLARRS
jgi:very-short-patch-repair endonuclease